MADAGAGRGGAGQSDALNPSREHHNPTNGGTTDTFTDAQGRRYIAGQRVPEEVWKRYETVVKHETYLMVHQAVKRLPDRAAIEWNGEVWVYGPAYDAILARTQREGRRSWWRRLLSHIGRNEAPQ